MRPGLVGVGCPDYNPGRTGAVEKIGIGVRLIPEEGLEEDGANQESKVKENHHKLVAISKEIRM